MYIVFAFKKPYSCSLYRRPLIKVFNLYLNSLPCVFQNFIKMYINVNFWISSCSNQIPFESGQYRTSHMIIKIILFPIHYKVPQSALIPLILFVLPGLINTVEHSEIKHNRVPIYFNEMRKIPVRDFSTSDNLTTLKILAKH